MHSVSVVEMSYRLPSHSVSVNALVNCGSVRQIRPEIVQGREAIEGGTQGSYYPTVGRDRTVTAQLFHRPRLCDGEGLRHA